jgi:hypothetical protein
MDKNWRIWAMTGILTGLTIAPVAGQDDAWWKGIFKPKSEGIDVHEPAQPTTPAVTAPNETPTDTISEPPSYGKPLEIFARVPEADPVEKAPAMPGVLTVEHSARLDTLDSLWRMNPPAIRGYRVQVYMGDLSAARAERARLRRLTNQPIYLEAMPPSYGLMVGDYRDKWAAERACADWRQTFPSSLVIPSDIRPLPLPEKELLLMKDE